MKQWPCEPLGLYSPAFERDSCGFALLCDLQDRPSHSLVQQAIAALCRLTHRGAVAPDGKTGDGCGIMLRRPDAFLRSCAAAAGVELGPLYAAAVVFLSQDVDEAAQAASQLTDCLAERHCTVAWRRPMPIDESVCGEEAYKRMPRIEQWFVVPSQQPADLGESPSKEDKADFQQRLYLARRHAEELLHEDRFFAVCSLSVDVLVYKGLVMPENLARFYMDLSDPAMASSAAICHQRFSTNTWPDWRLAQPFHCLAHNGEINTIRGNRNWAMARRAKLVNERLADLTSWHAPISREGSDSLSLDNMVMLLMAGGRDLFSAMRLLIPPAWQNVEHMHPDLRAMYEYYGMHMEPWDGPAAIAVTDGRHWACLLDRNGLRPARYVRTADDLVCFSSEAGVLDCPPEAVVAKGRLGPGEMIAVDMEAGQILQSMDIDNMLQRREPYKRWVRRQVRRLKAQHGQEPLVTVPLQGRALLLQEKFFGVTMEEREQVLMPLASLGQEGVGSMGDDTPLPMLSQQVRSLYDYFRQEFAQVTNPPIDPLREQVVMSIESCLGRELCLFDNSEQHAARLVVDGPVLTEERFNALYAQHELGYELATLSLLAPLEQKLEEALEALCNQAVEAVRRGVVLLVLSDRGAGPEWYAIHALLATGAIHHRLTELGLRCDASLIVETATARDPHHFACLLGYGASAVFPYLTYQVLHDLRSSSDMAAVSSPQALGNYVRGIHKGLLKIMSKMGIATLASYRGAQLFEIIGLSEAVVARCFRGTTSRIGGATWQDLEDDAKHLSRLAADATRPRSPGGLLKYVHGEEYHAYNPDVVKAMHGAVHSGQWHDYEKYMKLIHGRPPMVLRDLLDLRTAPAPLPLSEVEPRESILRCFDTAAMSLGALSPEAHEALAIAMNRLGGRSNSGEGGEDPARFADQRISKIKQVASGRFGVTPHYLVNAQVLQIKVAQGAKPGEGGQLPGHKVNELIAKLRYATPGVALISPPPHHDIYSIEDLAQLIFDLKEVNQQALVSVKLVAQPGVGTVAAGVVKAHADLITIAGYDGGTGASPLTSVKYAGGPWELGLAETHQTLCANNLRQKVRLQVDGGLKTGLDVIKGAILGAESFGFGTAPMIALGCKYLRICHLNNCATGVATQHKVLRTRYFTGLADHVEQFFHFVAEEVRLWLASLGVPRLRDLIGRTDLLVQRPELAMRMSRLDLSAILSHDALVEKRQSCTVRFNKPFDQAALAQRMVDECHEAISNKAGGLFRYEVSNRDRAIGARLSGHIARLHGLHGLDGPPLTIHLSGTVGQSLGAWNAPGLHLVLDGEANDYVGKGMAGGQIVLRPPQGVIYPSQQTVIMGNTCLYGATGGALFAAGVAGERFAVRNSGATAVVEGVGDHGCEYMTRGVVVILGRTGINFGAGMTGGVAFVLDMDGHFVDRYNHELIDIHRIATEQREAERFHLAELIRRAHEATGSAWMAEILENFPDYISQFWMVTPKATELSALLDALRNAA
jgi:glutamate synthase (NADPH/NADH) large chain